MIFKDLNVMIETMKKTKKGDDPFYVVYDKDITSVFNEEDFKFYVKQLADKLNEYLDDAINPISCYNLDPNNLDDCMKIAKYNCLSVVKY